MLKRKLNALMARARRTLVVFTHDVLVIPVAWLGALWLRFNLSTIPDHNWVACLSALPIVMLVQAVCYHAFGLYRGVWRFASMPDLVRIVKAVAVGVLVAASSLFFYQRLTDIPRSLFPLYSVLLIMLLGGARFVIRWQKDYGRLLKGQRVLIVGAGQSGESLVRELLRTEQDDYYPVAFLDDSDVRLGKEIHGIRVVGRTETLVSMVRKHNIDLVMLAKPDLNAGEMRRLMELCEQAHVTMVTLPSINDLASGRVSIDALRAVSLEDLLGRDPVQLDWAAIDAQVRGHRVLVTGGAGSIGSELCRQIAALSPAELVIVDHSEFALYKMQQECCARFPDGRIHTHLLDVTDQVAMNRLMQQHRFDVVFHAAAYKHVPMLENQIRVAVHNNILGTMAVANAAVLARVPKFVLISTDKAVHPVNVMGATKRGAEILCQNLNEHAATQFITVRFGNVLGSNGSVVPLFQQQIADGGPVTVTHPDITRYFMTIPEATQLILQASVLGQGGEIFVLDMGEPIKIRYLAEQMIRLAGFEVGKDIQIEFIGLRPGEKLYEELFHQNEDLLPTAHHKILSATTSKRDWQFLQELQNLMKEACDTMQLDALKAHLHHLVPEYLASTTNPIAEHPMVVTESLRG